jgi:hypothetical protein
MPCSSCRQTKRSTWRAFFALAREMKSPSSTVQVEKPWHASNQ